MLCSCPNLQVLLLSLRDDIGARLKNHTLLAFGSALAALPSRGVAKVGHLRSVLDTLSNDPLLRPSDRLSESPKSPISVRLNFPKDATLLTQSKAEECMRWVIQSANVWR